MPWQVFSVFSVWNQICQELEFIKLPLERFLTKSQNFDPFLWNKATSGRLNHIPEKLLWRFKDSKAVRNLKEEIKDHVDILDKWLLFSSLWVYHHVERLNLTSLTSTTSSEIVQELPGEVRNLVIDVLNDPVASILQGQLKPFKMSYRWQQWKEGNNFKLDFEAGA